MAYQNHNFISLAYRTAAALAFGLINRGEERSVLVYNFGGGNFDVSFITTDQGMFQVAASRGHTHLGGEDFNQRVMDFLIRKHKKKTGLDIGLNILLTVV